MKKIYFIRNSMYNSDASTQKEGRFGKVIRQSNREPLFRTYAFGRWSAYDLLVCVNLLSGRYLMLLADVYSIQSHSIASNRNKKDYSSEFSSGIMLPLQAIALICVYFLMISSKWIWNHKGEITSLTMG